MRSWHLDIGASFREWNLGMDRNKRWAPAMSKGGGRAAVLSEFGQLSPYGLAAPDLLHLCRFIDQSPCCSSHGITMFLVTHRYCSKSSESKHHRRLITRAQVRSPLTSIQEALRADRELKASLKANPRSLRPPNSIMLCVSASL
jgi:hypothetical protein